MGNHILNSKLLRDQFSNEEMRKVFSDENMVQKWIDVEVALAQVEAELELIPNEAALEIKKKGNVELFDFDRMKAGVDKSWHPIIPFIHEYDRLCENHLGEYLHWGTTTQDIMDTGLVLQIKEALALIESDLLKIRDSLCKKAVEHKNTVMAGRTHGQHALPITFGYKVAVWVAEINRHLERLNQIKPRVLTGNLTGAVGTLASLGDIGWDVQEKLMDKLALNMPEISWHVARDRIADLTSFLGMLGGTFGKIANEIMQLQKTEIAELSEPFERGKGGSSTMPQKRNPMATQVVMAASSLVRQRAGQGFEAMLQEHEREMGPWETEWVFIPELFQLASGITSHMTWILDGLMVFPEAMMANLNRSNQLIMSESVMMHVAEHLGRQESHDLIYELAMDAYEQDVPLSQVLKGHPKIQNILSDEEIDRILDPLSYVGLAQRYVDHVVSSIK